MLPSTPMDISLRRATPADAAVASELVQLSFNALVAPDWEADARQVFMGESSAASLQVALQSCAYAACAFDADAMRGFILMPRPTLVGMLFVHPDFLRRGIGKRLWEPAREFIEAAFPEAKTVELNASPFALNFYRSVGFVPLSAEFKRAGCRATRMACWLPARALGVELR